MHNCGRNTRFNNMGFLWEGRLSYTLHPFKEVWHIVILVEKETLKKEKQKENATQANVTHQSI